MRTGVGVAFVALGVLLLWLAVTGRLSHLGDAWNVLRGEASDATNVAPAANTNTARAAIQTADILNLPLPFPVVPQRSAAALN